MSTESPYLDHPDYWEKPGIDIRLNPRNKVDTTGVERLLRDRGILAAVVLATSGSSGTPKLVVLEKSALLVSAENVNRHCGLRADDIWLGGLSTFHVGGLGIYARAHLSGAEIDPMPWSDWTRDGSAFLEHCHRATLTSLTPVHLHDLVSAAIRCPGSLRGVFIGGGALGSELLERALALGWPVWTTYGMTEASSQIATSLTAELQDLPILAHWQTGITDSGLLRIEGPALMSGFLMRDNPESPWQWRDACEADGFYTTSDRATIDNQRITIHGRADDCIKILGELVSIPALQQSLSKILGGELQLIAMSDPRRGHRIHAFVESGEEAELIERWQRWNAAQPPFQQTETPRFLPSLPRTTAGKIDNNHLRSLVESR